MTVIQPEATPVLGNVWVQAILDVDDLEAIDLTTEWNNATSLALQCFLRPFSPSATQGSGSAPNRLCTTITLPQAGRTEIGAFELRYVYDPQGAPSDPANKALTLLAEGVVLTIAVRKGLNGKTAAAAEDQQYEAWTVRLGRQNRTVSSDDDFAEFEVSQMAFPIDDVTYGTIADA